MKKCVVSKKMTNVGGGTYSMAAKSMAKAIYNGLQYESNVISISMLCLGLATINQRLLEISNVAAMWRK